MGTYIKCDEQQRPKVNRRSVYESVGASRTVYAWYGTSGKWLFSHLEVDIGTTKSVLNVEDGAAGPEGISSSSVWKVKRWVNGAEGVRVRSLTAEEVDRQREQATEQVLRINRCIFLGVNCVFYCARWF